MKKKINLASTEKISKSQLDSLMKKAMLSVKQKSALAKKHLDIKIKQEILDAKKRFNI